MSETYILDTPWRIGTLKYLEIKIEEWPSRAKLGQSGPNGAKRGQMVPNDAKQSQTGPNWVKRGKMRPKRVLRGKMWLKGPNGPYEAK